MVGESKISYSKMRMNFYQKYQKQIVPYVQKYEKERKRNLFFAIIVSGTLLMIACACIIIFSSSIEPNFEDIKVLIKLVLFFISLACGAWVFIKKILENKLKNEIMPLVCSCFEDLTWSLGDCMDEYPDDSILYDGRIASRWSTWGVKCDCAPYPALYEK